jgi:putative flippase GtrA
MSRPIARLLASSELLRFTVVAVIGLAVDLTLAYGTHVLLGLPLTLAAALGFAAGAGVNYALHELWTFQAGAQGLSPRRALKYFLSLGATLAVRLVCVALLEWLLGPEQAFAALALATGLSFGVNYLFSKFMVFRPGHQDEVNRKTDEAP